MNKAIFWDLQGTLGGEAIGSIEQFKPYSFSRAALKLAKDHGFLNIIITNQSRIGKGLLSWQSYRVEETRIIAHFNTDELLIHDFLCCPHQEGDNCQCKKPKIGFILNCAEKYTLDIRKCYVVGDIGKNEIIMARNAGCKGILVLTGGGKDSLGTFRDTWANYNADLICDNAYDAALRIANSQD